MRAIKDAIVEEPIYTGNFGILKMSGQFYADVVSDTAGHDTDVMRRATQYIDRIGEQGKHIVLSVNGADFDSDGLRIIAHALRYEDRRKIIVGASARLKERLARTHMDERAEFYDREAKLEDGTETLSL